MAEYIEREDAIQAIKHAWAKGLEPLQYLEIIPTADVAPVRHGRWIIDKSFLPFVCTCSECGSSYDVDGAFEWDYCPECGARMDGGDGNADALLSNEEREKSAFGRFEIIAERYIFGNERDRLFGDPKLKQKADKLASVAVLTLAATCTAIGAIWLLGAACSIGCRRRSCQSKGGR